MITIIITSLLGTEVRRCAYILLAIHDIVRTRLNYVYDQSHDNKSGVVQTATTHVFQSQSIPCSFNDNVIPCQFL